jgi:phosphopantetheine adenylyltransferase
MIENKEKEGGTKGKQVGRIRQKMKVSLISYILFNFISSNFLFKFSTTQINNLQITKNSNTSKQINQIQNI